MNIPSSLYSTSLIPNVVIYSFSAGRLSEPGRVHPRFAAAEYGLGSTADPATTEVTATYNEGWSGLQRAAPVMSNSCTTTVLSSIEETFVSAEATGAEAPEYT